MTELKQKRKFTKYLVYVILGIVGGMLLFPSIFNNLKFGLDLQGGFEVLYQVSSLNDEKLTNDMLTNTYKTLSKRIDSLGVSEPVITIEGDDQIRVQLAGVTDKEAARETLGQVATLTFRDSNDNLLMTSDVLTSGGATVGQSSSGLPAVSLKVNKKDEFYRVTNNISKTEDKLIVIWLDFEEGVDSYTTEKNFCGTESSNCLSAATVSEGFASDVIIQGNFTTAEVKTLVTLINSGSLPTKLDEISSKTVDASFGVNSLNKTVYAGIIGFILVFIFMTAIYRFAGFIASFGLLIYALLTFGIYWLIGGVLTLPGIAAMILGIGMAVDSNVINYARIKDELRKGSSFDVAFKRGNVNSFKTIIDANVTTLLVAIILFIFGESSIKGFATMLIIGTIVTMVIMVWLVRVILKKFVDTGFFDQRTNLFVGRYDYKHNKFDFVKHSKAILIVTACVMIGGLLSIVINGLNLGIEFKGGTLISVGANVSQTEIEKELNEYTISSVESGDITNIKIKEFLNKEESIHLQNELNEEYNANVDIGVVSNMVQKEVIKNAMYSIILSIIGIILYVSTRFKFSFGVSAVAALIHDVFIIVVVFSLLKLEVTSIFIAALLTILGFSINDTIVVFDRIRENLASKKVKDEKELREIVNTSLRDTVVRSLITSVTTLLPVLTLIIFGANEIINFNIALLIGLIAGAYSSIFIAAQLWIEIEKRNINRPPRKKWYEDNGKEEKAVKGINS